MPPTSPTTRTGTRKLSEVAKYLVVPTDITSTGWPAVRRTCTEKLGITFDDWQDGAGRVMLAKRADGNLAAMIDGVGMSLPRQVGKTYLVGAMVFALCVNMPGLLVIWSAHHARTHGETFLAMQGFAGRQKVAPHVEQVFKGSGDEEIRFHNGSRILFGARERGFGRGIPGVDILIFDEAQILSDRALSNMLATLNTSRFGLQLYIGTPPKPDDMSEAFTRMRTEALEGRLTDGAWIEFGADAGAQVDDRTQWRKANPSHPKRTPVQSVLRLKRKLTPPDFLREGMGVWSEITKQLSVVPADIWATREAEDPPTEDAPPAAIAVDRWHDGTTAVAGAWRQDGRVHVELLALDVADTAQSVDWIAERTGRRIPLLIAADSPAAGMAADLLAKKVKVKLISTPEFARACKAFLDEAIEGPMTHAGQEQLDDALAGATKLPFGKAGAWVWDRRSPENDISSLVAATLARHGVTVAAPSESSSAFAF
jgi:hypothetical protein